MKSTFGAFIALFLLAPALLFAQKNNKPAKNEPAPPPVAISQEVLLTAEWAKYDYAEKVKKAHAGDVLALKSLFEFNNSVEGKEAILHGVTCLELIPSIPGDQAGAMITGLKPKLKPILLERLQEAQKKTQKEDLKKPITDWAPLVWKALNGERVVCTSCMHLQGDMSMPPQKPGQKPSATSTPLNQEQEKQ
jgi:hypothetical protein